MEPKVTVLIFQQQTRQDNLKYEILISIQIHIQILVMSVSECKDPSFIPFFICVHPADKL